MLLAVHYRVMEHLGSLESTQEARVALGYTSGNSYASFVLSKLPACSITRWCTLKHEPIVNSPYGLVQFFLVFEKFARAYLFEIALDIIWLPIQNNFRFLISILWDVIVILTGGLIIQTSLALKFGRHHPGKSVAWTVRKFVFKTGKWMCML